MPTHNGEDRILDAILGPQQCGFYLDVGANDPYTTSNTHHLYQRGWRGIDIEANPQWLERLKAAHPANLIYNVCASDRYGSTHLYRFKQHENDTMIPSINVALQQSGKNPIERVNVQSMPLDSILDAAIGFWPWQNNKSVIDFVSIDVEGAEGQVLAGFNLSRWKPNVLCIETTNPLDLNIRTDGAWRDILFAAGYLYHPEHSFDGCNAWFIRKDLL